MVYWKPHSVTYIERSNSRNSILPIAEKKKRLEIDRLGFLHNDALMVVQEMKKQKTYMFIWVCGHCGGRSMNDVQKSDTGKTIELTCSNCAYTSKIVIGKNNA